MRESQLYLPLLCLFVLFSACNGSITEETEDAMGSPMSTEDTVLNELSQLVNGHGDPERELAGLAVAVLRQGEVVFQATLGQAHRVEGRELTPQSLMRVASISKVLSAVVVMQLVEDGLLDLDADVSQYLGWDLRNPHYRDRAITLRQLLSHSSSIRDAGESYIIRYPRALREAFDPEGPDFGERFQDSGGEADRGPGTFYEYCNLNYGVVGTILEKVTGRRFDRLMHERFFSALGLAGGFNVAEFSAADQENVATLYRKRDENEVWHPQGKWVAQVDDLSEGIPTALPEGAVYEPGTNGAQFSPQGGARMSLTGLTTLARLLAGDGSIGETRILTSDSMAELRRPAWIFQADPRNIAQDNSRTRAYSPGLRIMTSETEADSLFAEDDRGWAGHFGEAYGLLAGVFVHPESGDGVIFAITGTAFDPYADSDGTSTLVSIEARILEQLGRLL